MQASSPREDRLDDRGAQTLDNYQIIRRNGAVVPFEPSKIAVAVMKAFLAVHGTQGAASASVRDTVDGLT
ncbi:MAG TPA: ATP cone domain-containing protein, partial [Burkholderiaceae bacterium]|nr:ATP cone domain-containing protein [Burkholderiaceae bacterium]